MSQKRYTKKQIKKLVQKNYFFCHEDNYALLDAHRIHEGCKGGTYHELNMLCVCSNCHRRVHSGEIVIDRKYMSTKGIVVHYWRNGKEFWEQE
jgi:hypothetical protein